MSAQAAVDVMPMALQMRTEPAASDERRDRGGGGGGGPPLR
jgi:hypothetical protein